jgi:hypothetical protein
LEGIFLLLLKDTKNGKRGRIIMQRLEGKKGEIDLNYGRNNEKIEIKRVFEYGILVKNKCQMDNQPCNVFYPWNTILRIKLPLDD